MKKILVTGATGQLGSSVIETLLKKMIESQISIITRIEEKRVQFQAKGFNAFRASYDDVVSLENAMEGVDTVLLISSGDQGDRMQEHRNVIDTAKKTGVKHIAYTSRCLNNRNTLANKLMVEHFETEDYILSTGLKYTIFRNILYMDAIPQFIGGNIALERGIFLPAADGKVSFALRSEIGEAMANVLLSEEIENKIYNFTSDKAYSFYDIATALTDLSGKTVKYTSVETNVFEGMMKQRNLPEPVILKIVDFITDIKHNQEAGIFNDLEIILGRKPSGLKNGLKTLFGL
ncbi:SDR family oxidoreductase [Dyadobacter frigoris]|uniref:SDR family oxidoreductase n=1 Tax=Dyadobacter frigoris TaxID=2576211 RepID=A0A4U6CZR2_9BACT|nr:SDR family oxidoreductase [Dyadobacter frigoris]TKT90380.1 SDR family oxidoreductase [Dyadobacter frigoris]GLU57288.1 NAD(P)-dependent oxidoreductase [Dyadobacter frigoris]